MEYVEETESAKIMHKWAALSTIASALRKKVHLSLGRIRVYPNMYVVFVGEPGGPRKSQAINYSNSFLTDVPEVEISADAITPQALLEDLETAAKNEQMPDGSIFEHTSLTVNSREFESFLGQKTDNTKMINILTDLFDSQEVPWRYRTKKSGSNTLPSVFLNILAATTPESISVSLPSTAIGTGLTSRIMFIWAEKKHKKVTTPTETEREKRLREKLAKDLYLISRLVGEYNFSEDCYRRWDEWYQNFDERSPNRICKDPLFNGWYERKPLYIQKLAMVCAASSSDNLVIEWRHIERALALVEEAEIPMPNVFRAVGRSIVAIDVDLIIGIVANHKTIKEEDLLELIWKDVDMSKWRNVVDTACQTKKIQRRFKGPNGEPGTWYFYVGGDRR